VLVGDCGRTLGKYGTLECKFIIHAVGPIYDQFTPKVAENLLISAVINTLEKAKELVSKASPSQLSLLESLDSQKMIVHILYNPFVQNGQPQKTQGL